MRPAALASAAGAVVVWAAVIALPEAASAQFTATVGEASDYRLRGLSLTDHRPATTFSVAYDGAAGVYAGGAAVASADFNQTRFVGATEYAGLTRPLGGDLSWDAGASYQDYTLYFQQRSRLRYAEIYLGLIWRDLSGHVYFKPNNPRSGIDSTYADVNWSIHPMRAWRMMAHLGANQRLGGFEARDGGRWRFDTQLGAVREFAHSELELTWTGSAAERIPHPVQTRPGFAVGGRYFF